MSKSKHFSDWSSDVSRTVGAAPKRFPPPCLSAPSLIQHDINHRSGLLSINSEDTLYNTHTHTHRGHWIHLFKNLDMFIRVIWWQRRLFHVCLLAKTSTSSNNNNKSVRGNVRAHTHLRVISFSGLVKSFSGFFVLFTWNKRWTNKGKWSSSWMLSYTAHTDQDGRLCCVRRVHHQTGSFLELTSVPIIFNGCPRLCSPPSDDTVIFWNISLTVGTAAALLCSPLCRRPHRGMTCRRHIQAGWPSCWRDVGDRISLQQTMAVMRVDSVKPLFWRPVERAVLANLNKCTLGRKKRGKFFGSLVLSAASCSIDSHARRMPLCIPGKRNFGLSNFQFPPLSRKSFSFILKAS